MRVLVDGKIVQEDWTHHGPTEHKTVLTLQAGEHTFVVEHFELTGYAVLTFDTKLWTWAVVGTMPVPVANFASYVSVEANSVALAVRQRAPTFRFAHNRAAHTVWR